MTVKSFNEETKVLLFNVNERQREFRDNNGQVLSLLALLVQKYKY